MAKALTEFTAGSDGSMEETKKGVKALLLENVCSHLLVASLFHQLNRRIYVNESGVALLRGQNYVVDTEKASLSEDDLIKRLREGQYQILGIRSKTKVTRKVIESCTNVGPLALGFGRKADAHTMYPYSFSSLAASASVQTRSIFLRQRKLV